MGYKEVRDKFSKFFTAEGHQLVPSSSLIPEHDASVLLTTAGMQQFKPYFVGLKDSDKDFGTRNVVSIQKCFRTADIDDVGNETHLTFFEMLGNFSFGGYFKKEAIEYAWEFLTDPQWMGIDRSRIEATYYDGKLQGTKEDRESKRILEQVDGLEKITPQSESENFWGPTGDEGPCGPTVEFHVDGVEIWNIVFNEYYCWGDKSITPLKLKGVDTGMGLERLLVAVTPTAKSVYETDAFWPIIEEIKEHTPGVEAGINRSMRIVADHLRGSVFLLADHIQPSNKEQGYILRRLLRRAILHLDKLEALGGFEEVINSIISQYGDFYPELLSQRSMIIQLANLERDKFLKTITQGRKELDKIVAESKNTIAGAQAFDLFTTYGLPLDFIKEEAAKHKLRVDETGFNQAFQAHQEVSRAGVESKFGGHGLSSGTQVSAPDKQKITRLHTATHLLHAALIKFLGNEVKQAGSDLNTERARFDFTFPRALTDKEKEKVEAWVNQQISKDLPVKQETKPIQEALKGGALSFFKEKYPDVVDVYTIYDPKADIVISQELCGGPHVKRTGEIGDFKIVKEQSSSAGVRRIRAVIN